MRPVHAEYFRADSSNVALFNANVTVSFHFACKTARQFDAEILPLGHNLWLCAVAHPEVAIRSPAGLVNCV